MAKMIAFSVYDAKAEFYGNPMFFPAPGLAIRQFTDLCRDAEHPFGKHPGDYGLYRVGQFDDSNGSFEADVAPVLMVSGNEVAGVKELRVERA